MIKALKSKSLLFYFIISLFFYEIVLKLSISQPISQESIFYIIMFSISLSILFFFVATLFDGKDVFVLTLILLLALSVIFCSQMIYYRFFKTYYTVFSATQGGQVLEFWKDILFILKKSWFWIVLFFLPPILALILKNRLLFCQRPKLVGFVLLLVLLVFFHGFAIVDIYFGDRGSNSPYNLYTSPGNPFLSADKLGLLTAMRLDAQRLIFGDDFSVLPKPSNDDVINPIAEDKDVYNPNVPDTPSDSIDQDETDDQTNDEIEENIIREPNILDIDFDKLINNEQDEKVKDMHRYFSSLSPTYKNEYTGKYEGYNLILITAESFSPYAVHKDVTPTLYKMVNEGYKFTNFYNPIWEVSTLDGEYVACTSLLPKRGVWSFYHSGKNLMPFTMGNQFMKLGYKTMAYHNHTYDYYNRHISHPNMGYEYKGIGNGLEMSKAWPRSDLEMMEKTIPEYINDQPFHVYYMTVSGHMQYNFIGNHMAIKNKEYVKDLPYTEAGKAFIATQIELDRAMEYLLDQLEQAGIADKTLIAISADHYPYGLEHHEIEDLAGHEVEKNFELYKSPFILYTKGMEPVTIDKPCSSLDIIPTLSNLLGLEYDSRLLMGRDIFSDSEPLVIFNNKSFITDKGRYNAVTQEFFPEDGQQVDQQYINEILDIIEKKFYYSAMILDTDYYKHVVEE